MFYIKYKKIAQLNQYNLHSQSKIGNNRKVWVKKKQNCFKALRKKQ